jgi:hypothetical protein
MEALRPKDREADTVDELVPELVKNAFVDDRLVAVFWGSRNTDGTVMPRNIKCSYTFAQGQFRMPLTPLGSCFL